MMLENCVFLLKLSRDDKHQLRNDIMFRFAYEHQPKFLSSELNHLKKNSLKQMKGLGGVSCMVFYLQGKGLF